MLNTGKFVRILLISLAVIGCSSVKQLAVEKDVTSILKSSEVFSKHFTGFSLFDIDQNDYIANYNSTLLFTPASNTKLLTMYVTLKSFQDSIPGLKVNQTGNTLTIQPVGDPTFLYQPFISQPVFDYLSSQSAVQLAFPEDPLAPFGSGWAWDDYLYDFQPQRSWMPIYGNRVSICKTDSILSVSPPFFADFVDVEEQTRPGELVDRALDYNLFKAYLDNDTTDFERNIPFDYSDELLIQLLADTLKMPVKLSTAPFIATDTIYSQPVDSVLAYMMKPSDNFLAEQLLLLSAREHGYPDINSFIKHVQTVWLSDMNEMVWVDGSGLSRYNLIAPVDQVRLLRKCYQEFGWERITGILATGGEGTLKELYLSEDEPFIYAKTGTLSNNHNLSGLLTTKSGKRLIFSFMNNHYVRPTDEIKRAMEQFLMDLREAY